MKPSHNYRDELPVDTIQAALSYISPDTDREEWARVGMALKSELGADGFSMFDQWSSTGRGYSKRDTRDTWRSISGDGGVSIGTLIHMAKQGGFKLGAKVSTITPEESAERRARREAQEAKERAARQAAEDRAVREAARMLDSAQLLKSANDHHYTRRKGIKSTGKVYLGTYSRWTGEYVADIEDALLIPIGDQHGVTGLQAIFADEGNELERDRDFLPGSRKRGCWFEVPGSADVILIGEGYATGCSLHDATGYTAIVAFDAGNLAEVAQAMRQIHPQAEIVICADDDRWKDPEKNPGVQAAKRAASLCAGKVAIPVFSSADGEPTDFNDLAVREGLPRVREIIDGILGRLVPANDNKAKAADRQVAQRQRGYDLNAVDWYGQFPDVNGKGKPIATIENVVEACRRLGVMVRYNVINKEIEILIPNEGFSIDNSSNAALAWLTSCCTRFGVPTDKLGDFLTYIADRNPYNPVANWITSKPWDGVQRLPALMASIEAEGQQEDPEVLKLKDAMIKRWMISAVAGAFRPTGVSAHGVLVLQGSQYLGKTKWFKSLVPAEIGVIQDGLMLRPDDRDSVKQAVSFWLVELGELDATFRKSDIAQLKAFITRDRDTLRRAYAKLESHYARRTVFFASVNPRQFLHDPTGNRRYWTISCTSINADHGLDMQQVWAEVYENHYLKGEEWFLLPEEMAALNDHNKDHEVLDPIRERLLTRMDWDAPPTMWRWMTATDIMLEIGFDKPNRADVTQCGQLVQELNNGQRRKSNGKAQSKVPPLNPR